MPLYTPECGECKFCKVWRSSFVVLMGRAVRPIYVARFALLRGKGKCQMAPLVSVQEGKISFIIWEHPLFLNTPVVGSESCPDL